MKFIGRGSLLCVGGMAGRGWTCPPWVVSRSPGRSSAGCGAAAHGQRKGAGLNAAVYLVHAGNGRSLTGGHGNRPAGKDAASPVNRAVGAYLCGVQARGLGARLESLAGVLLGKLRNRRRGCCPLRLRSSVIWTAAACSRSRVVLLGGLAAALAFFFMSASTFPAYWPLISPDNPFRQHAGKSGGPS